MCSKYFTRGSRHSIARQDIRLLVLHMDNLGSIPGIPYGSLSLPGVSESRVQIQQELLSLGV